MINEIEIYKDLEQTLKKVEILSVKNDAYGCSFWLDKENKIKDMLWEIKKTYQV